MTDRSSVHVVVDATDLGPEREVGQLHREGSGRSSVMSFAYSRTWLADRNSFALDPSVGTWDGDQFFEKLPGIFADSAPDRWGRILMERREAILAKRERRSRRSLGDWDFLVGVADEVRMGAIRYRGDDGEYVARDRLSVPPVTRLRTLERYARDAELGIPEREADEARWLSMLIAPGSSLGGARPKGNYVETDGTLWIAKFPSRHDRIDVGAWEYVLSRIARSAGITTPDARLLRLGNPHATFAVRRFDRDRDRRRLFASAMTLTRRSDGDEASYLDIAMAIRDQVDPQHIRVDQNELFRRLVFNVIFANRDDHLRNHGFLRTPRGWRLSPAFDVNPSPGQTDHALAVADGIHEAALDAVSESAALYGVRDPVAIIESVRGAAKSWRRVARQAGISRDEMDLVGASFQVRADG